MEARQSDIVVRRIDELTPAERTIIDYLCTIAFGPSDRSLFDYLPPTAMHLFALVAGRLVSHACWTTRELQPDGLPPLQTAYVDAVATFPADRNRGYASAVLQRLATETADFALRGLSTSRFGFYERLGWERWRGTRAVREAGGLRATLDDGVMILRTAQTPPLDLDGLIIADPRGAQPW